MFNVGGAEMLVILVVALIVLGPNRLPDAARQAGKWLGEFRRISTGFQREMRDAMNEISQPFDTTPTSTNGESANGAAKPAGLPSLDKPSTSTPPAGPEHGEASGDLAG
jgi:sec-independent protein translocase protein TatB